MGHVSKILLLAGSAEAAEIVRAAAKRGIAVAPLLSERLRGPVAMPSGAVVLEEVSETAIAGRLAGVDAVVDASHAFDSAMTQSVHAAARAAGVPILSLSRAPWDAAEDALWRRAPDVQTAVEAIPPATRVFSATGWASLPEFAGFAGERLFLRQTTRHARTPPYDFVVPVFGQAPFSAGGERALFERLGIDLLICRNLGGVPSRPKLDAARVLRLPVILIDRPAKPEGLAVVARVEEVMTWLETV